MSLEKAARVLPSQLAPKDHTSLSAEKRDHLDTEEFFTLFQIRK